MSDWLIRQRYGFGAAQVRLMTRPLATNAVQWTLREGATAALRELRENGSSGLIGMVPALAFGLVVLIAPAIAMLPLGSDQLEFDLVLLETARLDPAPVAPPIPTTRPEPTPEPLPPPTPVAPEPPPIAKPPPPPPAAAPPKPAPPKPAPPAPRVVPTPLPAPIAVADAPIERAPESLRAPRPTRSEPARPKLHVDPLAAAPATPGRDFSPVRTRQASRRVATSAKPRPVARIDALAPTAEVGAAAATSHRDTRPRAHRSARATRSEVRASALALPGLANEPAPARPIDHAKVVPRRPPPPAAPMPTGKSRSDSPELAGVPLAALASCISDREEDRLKQKVLASVGSRRECASAAGRYVFVETRNLNAFLMNVKRAPSRRTADRCIELSLALDCLAQSRRKETGRL